MNILFVTKNAQDAGIFEAELAKRVPGLQIDTVRGVPRAIGRLASPGDFSALLLDAMPQEADLLALIRTARAEKGPITVIALVAADDPDSGTRLVNEGADDFVVKNSGFVDNLAAVLRRAGGGVPRVLYAVGGAEATSVPEPSSMKLDTAGATRVLIRESDGEPAGKHAGRIHADPEERLLQDKELSDPMGKAPPAAKTLSLKRPLPKADPQPQRMEEEPSQAPERDLEQMLKEAGQENARLLEVLSGLEIQLIDKTGELQREREQWDLFRLALNRKLTAIENRHAGLERALLEEEHQKRKVAEHHAAEMSRSENARDAWEKRYRAAAEENAQLKDSWQTAETRMAGLLEQHQAEMGRWESVRLAMERQNRELQEKIGQQEKANAMLEHECRELENHAGGMAEELRRIIETHNGLIAKHRAELAEIAMPVASGEEDPDLDRRRA